MSKLKDIVEQVHEQPSPRCWESIASQLPAAGAAVSGGAAATAAKGALSAGKLAAIIGSATAVVAVVTVSTIAILSHEPTSVPQPTPEANTTTLVINHTETTEENSPNLTKTVTDVPDFTPETPIKADKSSSSKTKETEKTTEELVQNTQTKPTTITANTPTAVMIPATQANTNNPTSPTTPKPTTTTANVSSKITSESSKVTNENAEVKGEKEEETENHTPWENTAYSRPIMIEIPNIFTPNADGVNDQFVINGIEQCDKRMLIVKNQKGETVFQSNHYDNSWDGANLPDGSYYYQFMYSINNINEVRKGVVLIRR